MSLLKVKNRIVFFLFYFSTLICEDKTPVATYRIEVVIQGEAITEESTHNIFNTIAKIDSQKQIIKARCESIHKKDLHMLKSTLLFFNIKNEDIILLKKNNNNNNNPSEQYNYIEFYVYDLAKT